MNKADEYVRVNPSVDYGNIAVYSHNDVQKMKDKIAELEQENNKLLDVINNQDVKIADLEQQIEKMKCGQNCKHEYWINTGGCYDQKCRFTGLDCTNCKDDWKGKWEND